MNLPNRITLDTFTQVPIGEIAALPAEELALLQEEIDAALRRAKLSCDWLDGALTLKYGDRLHAARQAAGKDTGAIRIEDGAITAIADLPKRIDWNQKKLAALVERIRAEGDDPADYVEIAIKAPSAKFSAWPGPIRAAFEEARSLRTGKPSYRLELVAATGGK